MGVPGASRCPVGHTPVERAPGALGPWALRGWGLGPSLQGAPPLGALGLGAPPRRPPAGAGLGIVAELYRCAPRGGVL